MLHVAVDTVRHAESESTNMYVSMYIYYGIKMDLIRRNTLRASSKKLFYPEHFWRVFQLSTPREPPPPELLEHKLTN